MLVFDLCDESAISNMKQHWIPKVLKSADPNVELLLVGNKSDLVNDRLIEQDQIEKFIEEI